MLSSLDFIGNIGTFGQVSTGKSLPLAQLTLIYGENSRGKTTLAEILRSLSTDDPTPILERSKLDTSEPPRVVLQVESAANAVIFNDFGWNSGPVGELRVFDDAFVDGNVCSGLEVQSTHRRNLHELILGEQGVDLNDAIQEQVDSITSHNAALRTAAEAIIEAVPFALRVEDVPAFCNTPLRPDVDAELQEHQLSLDAARRYGEMAAATRFTDVAIPELDGDGVDSLLGTSLDSLSTIAAERVHLHTQTLGIRSEQWLSDGIQFLSLDDQEPLCPFCAQPLSGSALIEHYREYFGQEYGDLKQRISMTATDLRLQHGSEAQIGFERTISTNQELTHFWNQFVSIDEDELQLEAEPITSAWSAARDEMLAHVSKKQAAPLEEMALSTDTHALLEAYEAHRARVMKASAAIQEANKAIQDRLDEAAGANPNQIAAEIDQLRRAQVRHSDALIPLCDAYLNEAKEKEITEAKRDAAKEALDDYRDTVFPAYESGLNHYLEKFGAGFRIRELKSRDSGAGTTSTYALEVNGRLVHVRRENVTPGEHAFRSTLSSGDRNTLAFALFLESINQSQDPGNIIAVVDDPVSSQDEGRFATTVAEICKLVGKVRQVIVLSHNKRFLCQIWEDIERDYRDSRVAIEIVRHGQESTFAEWNVTDQLITLHDHRHRLFTEYLDSGSGDPREVATALRPHLEAFLRVARPALFVPGTLLGSFVSTCKQRIQSGDAVLNNEKIQELEELIKYGNQFHHDTNPAYATVQIINAELATFTKRVLAFTEPQ